MKVNGAVETGLSALTSGVRRQAALGFACDEKLIDIPRDLRFKLADHGVEPEDLRYSGHGYANLLYGAVAKDHKGTHSKLRYVEFHADFAEINDVQRDGFCAGTG